MYVFVCKCTTLNYYLLKYVHILTLLTYLLSRADCVIITIQCDIKRKQGVWNTASFTISPI